MTVFVEFTCFDCGSFEVIAVDDVRQRLLRESPPRCRDCAAAVVVDVRYDFDPSDGAWFAEFLQAKPTSRRRHTLATPLPNDRR
jgi:hypothetical protein